MTAGEDRRLGLADQRGDGDERVSLGFEAVDDLRQRLDRLSPRIAAGVVQQDAVAVVFGRVIFGVVDVVYDG